MTTKLPSQAYFLQHGLEFGNPDCSRGDHTCSICSSGFLTPSEDDDAQYEAAVNIKACGHWFHERCIRTWFTSTHPRRTTCPNCRHELFESDLLNGEQIESLFEDEQVADTDFDYQRERISSRPLLSAFQQALQSLSMEIAWLQELIEVDRHLQQTQRLTGRTQVLRQNSRHTSLRRHIAGLNAASILSSAESMARLVNTIFLIDGGVQMTPIRTPGSGDWLEWVREALPDAESAVVVDYQPKSGRFRRFVNYVSTVRRRLHRALKQWDLNDPDRRQVVDVRPNIDQPTPTPPALYSTLTGLQQLIRWAYGDASLERIRFLQDQAPVLTPSRPGLLLGQDSAATSQNVTVRVGTVRSQFAEWNYQLDEDVAPHPSQAVVVNAD